MSQTTAELRPLPIRMRKDLVVHPQRYGGKAYWGIKDPVSLRYFQLREEEYFIFGMLDGANSLKQIQTRFEQRFSPRRLSMQQLQAFLGMLHRQGLVLSETVGQGGELLGRRNRIRRHAVTQKFSSILAIRFRGIDPEQFLGWIETKVRWIYSKWCIAFCVLLMLAALTHAAVHFETLQSRLPDLATLLNPGNVVWIVVTIAIAKILHELGHGITCKHFGGECHEMGVMLLAFTPCLYCNVSDAWMLPNKWHRIAISAAGMYVELVLASLCLFLWWFSIPGLLHALCLNMIIVCSISTIIFNGNPLLRYDGYYILGDLLEIPNFRQQSSVLLRNWLARWFLGLEGASERFLPQRHRALLVFYTIASTVYRWVVVVAILWIVHEFLKPHGLELIAQFLAVAVVAGMVLTPAFRLMSLFRDPAMSRRIKWNLFFVRTGLIAAVIAVLVLVPLPYRITVPVALEPQDAKRVYVSLDGRLTESVELGEAVQSGQTLAKLKNLELVFEIEKLTGQRNQQELEIANLKHRRVSDSSVEELIPTARKRLQDINDRLRNRMHDRDQLVLTAPIAGTVIPPHHVSRRPPPDALDRWNGTPLDDENKDSYLETGTLFCLIGDPDRLEAHLIIDQRDVEFVGRDQRVEIMLDQSPGTVLWGTIVEVAELDLEETPKELLAHDDIATEIDDNGITRPVHTTYQARVELDDHEHHLLIGAPGRAKIHVAPQTLAKRLYRYLSGTFRFKL